MSAEIHEDSSTSPRPWLKVELYRKKVGDNAFKAINENTYRAGDVEISLTPTTKLDLSELYSVLPPDRECIEEFAVTYVGKVHLLGEDGETANWRLTFVVTNVKYKDTLTEQIEMFEDGVFLPEAYRGWEVALDMYKAMLDFAKRTWVKKFNSDCDLSKGANSIYKRLQWEWYKFVVNPTSRWTDDDKLKSADTFPNYTLEF